MDPIKFDSILPKEVSVDLGEEKYILKAPSAAVTNKFRAALSDCYKVEGDVTSLTKPSKAVELHTGLISQCLYDSGGKLVPLTTIMGWPNPIVEALIKGSVELCEFSKEEDLKK